MTSVLQARAGVKNESVVSRPRPWPHCWSVLLESFFLGGVYARRITADLSCSFRGREGAGDDYCSWHFNFYICLGKYLFLQQNLGKMVINAWNCALATTVLMVNQ